MSRQLQPSENPRRLNDSEGHGSPRDRTLAVLVEQALRIKGEVTAGLQANRGLLQVETISRKLLESHILTITRIVQQLSSDVQALQRQLVRLDSAASVTPMDAHQQQLKNTRGLGDHSGNLAGVSRPSAEAPSAHQQVIRLQEDVAKLRTSTEKGLKELERKVQQGISRLEESLIKHSRSLNTSQDDLLKQFQRLEERMKEEMKAAEQQRLLLQSWTEEQFNISAHAQAQHEQQLHALQDRMSKTEWRLSDRLLTLELHMEQLETERHRSDRSLSDQLQLSEDRMGKRMTSMESSLHDELQLLKQKYDKGFLSVHDSIRSFKEICDLKSRLDKNTLQVDGKDTGSAGSEREC